MPTSEEAAAQAAAEIVDTPDPQTPEGETPETPEFPSLDVALPPDLSALLEEDDSDLEVSEEELDDLEQENMAVPREVLARMRAAEKKAEHFEKLRAAEARKSWTDEAEKFFPLSQPFLDQIDATSKRAYLRTAKQIHDKMLPLVDEKVLKPAREAIEKEKQKTSEEVKNEARAAWGAPIVENEQKTEPRPLQSEHRRRQRMELSDVIRGMIFTKEA